MSDDEDWTEAERARLAALTREEAPPPRLQARVLDALRLRGLLQPRRRPTWTVAAAAALAGIVGGMALGRLTVPDRAGRPAPSGRSFVLLLYPAAAGEAGAGDERARVEEYRAWARGLAAQGRLVSGEKLEPSVRLLRATPPASAEDVDPNGHLQGFFLLRARSLEEAEGIARTCPHLRHGGTIALREIQPT